MAFSDFRDNFVFPWVYVINKLTTQTHCRMKTYDDVTGTPEVVKT